MPISPIGVNVRPRWLALVWPPLLASDSEFLRRRKLGVRGFNGVFLGVVLLLLGGLAGERGRAGQWGRLAAVAVGTVG